MGIVIPIRRVFPISTADELVANFAYTLWLSSAFLGGTPEAAFFAALRMIKGKSSAELFLVPKRKQPLRPIIVMKSRSGGGLR